MFTETNEFRFMHFCSALDACGWDKHCGKKRICLTSNYGLTRVDQVFLLLCESSSWRRIGRLG